MKNDVALANFLEFINIANDILFTRLPSELFLWMTKTDYFIAPGSHKYHDSIPGGLYNHSKSVYKALCHINEISKVKYSKETLFIIAFAHDFAKINYYHKTKKFRKDDNNKWLEYETYEIIDDYPLPHGTKSLMMVSKYFTLTEELQLAIVYHMGYYHISKDAMSESSFYNAREKTPLVSMLHLADMMAVDVV